MHIFRIEKQYFHYLCKIGNHKIMTRKFMLLLCAAFLWAACEKKSHEHPDNIPAPEIPAEKPEETVKGTFAKGADISWVTQMEADGQKFYSADGREMECTVLMKEIGFDAIRLRR